MACSFTLKGVFCLIASVSKLKQHFYKYTSDFLLSLFEFVVSEQQPQQSFPNEPPGHGSDRWKPNATHRLLNLRRHHIDREVTPFQVLSVRANLRMEMLSHFAVKDCKLQYDSSLNVSNQELAPKHKPIAGWHQPVMHWGEWEEIKNRKVFGRRFTQPVLSLSLCLKVLLGGWWAAHRYWSGWSLEVKDWGLCLFLLTVYLSLSAHLSPL